MRRLSISFVIRNAVLCAMAPAACGQGQVSQSDDASTESGTPVDATIADTSSDDVDAGDADLDASTTVDIQLLPLPDGCAVSGKPDGFAPCGYTEDLSDYAACQIDHDANTQEASVCYLLCDPTEPDCIYYDLGDSGGSILTCGPGCIGRLQREGRDAFDTCSPLSETAGDFLARAATLEAAAIEAFHALANELAYHGADDLAAAARRAAKDEVRHARTMHRLARARHRAPKRVTRVATHLPRSIFAIAIENAEEGCVRETFGAALAMWQAENAQDDDVRAAMQTIARDECDHAELGFRIAEWARARLTERERAHVDAVRARAFDAMERDVTSLDDVTRTELGLPNADHARAIVRSLRAELS